MRRPIKLSYQLCIIYIGIIHDNDRVFHTFSLMFPFEPDRTQRKKVVSKPNIHKKNRADSKMPSTPNNTCLSIYGLIYYKVVV